METFITGYCRCLDKSRIVLVEDGEADCAYENCPHKESCEIGKRIAQLLTEIDNERRRRDADLAFDGGGF